MDTPPSQPAATPPISTPTAPASITIDDFAKIQLRVGTVIECKPHTKGDRLLVLQIDLGDEKRQILAGIRKHVAPEAMLGKQVVIVANLAPRELMGLTSHGMLLAASDTPTGKIVPVTVADAVAPGSGVR